MLSYAPFYYKEMSVTPHPEETLLLAQISQGDELAFTSVFNHYVKPLSAFVFKLTQSVPLTEEVIQDSFITLWLKKESLGAVSNFGGYLYTICRNNALAALKKIAKEAVCTAVLAQEMLYDLELVDDSERIAEYRALLALAVEKLPTQQRKVYQMSRYERLKHQEIAAKLGISAETVKKHIQLAVSAIERDLKNQLQLPVLVVLTSSLF